MQAKGSKTAPGVAEGDETGNLSDAAQEYQGLHSSNGAGVGQQVGTMTLFTKHAVAMKDCFVPVLGVVGFSK